MPEVTAEAHEPENYHIPCMKSPPRIRWGVTLRCAKGCPPLPFMAALSPRQPHLCASPTLDFIIIFLMMWLNRLVYLGRKFFPHHFWHSLCGCASSWGLCEKTERTARQGSLVLSDLQGSCSALHYNGAVLGQQARKPVPTHFVRQ